jgi:hypothetical protein
LLVLLIFLVISEYKFDQVFDVMLHTVSPPRGEAASPPSPRCRYSQNAVTFAAFQLHAQTCSYRHNPGLFSSGAGHLKRWVLSRCWVEVLVRFGCSGRVMGLGAVKSCWLFRCPNSKNKFGCETAWAHVGSQYREYSHLKSQVICRPASLKCGLKADAMSLPILLSSVQYLELGRYQMSSMGVG